MVPSGQSARPGLTLPLPARRQGCPPPALLLPPLQQLSSSVPAAPGSAVTRQRHTVAGASAARTSAAAQGSGSSSSGGDDGQPQAKVPDRRKGERRLALKAAAVQQDLAQMVNMQRRALQQRGQEASPSQHQRRPPGAQTGAPDAPVSEQVQEGEDAQQRRRQARKEGQQGQQGQHSQQQQTAPSRHARGRPRSALQSISVGTDDMDAAIAHTFPVTGSAAPSDSAPGSRKPAPSPGAGRSSQRSSSSRRAGSGVGATGSGGHEAQGRGTQRERWQGQQRQRQQGQGQKGAAPAWPPSLPANVSNVLVVSAALINAQNEVRWG